MITLTHLAIAAILLITFGAFLVQRSAVESARSYKRGKADGLQDDAKRHRAARQTAVVSGETGSPDVAPTQEELMARWTAHLFRQADEESALSEHFANLARSLPTAYTPAKQAPPQRAEGVPRSLFTDFPFNKG